MEGDGLTRQFVTVNSGSSVWLRPALLSLALYNVAYLLYFIAQRAAVVRRESERFFSCVRLANAELIQQPRRQM